MKKYRAFGRDFNINEIAILFIFLGVMVCAMGIAIIYDISTPPPPPQMIEFYGFRIWAWLPSFIVLSIAIAWMVHGFGFIIVRA